jgi:hypothetical protein
MWSLRRPLAGALAAFWTLVPATALAQAPKAGVVTTLEGPVTARRAVLPAPVALRFKDDIFLRDTVTTGERGFARFLLGGKAVVTVRERSVMTITEVPGRSTVELESGKIGLAVARERMQPGEVIDVRTPNAIVAVRGTVLVAEVGQTAAQGTTAPQPITSVYMIRGNASADALNPSTRAALGTPFVISDLQALNVVGASPPKVSTFTVDQIGQITAGLKPRGLQHKDPVNQEQIKEQAVGATSAVLTALAVAPETPMTIGDLFTGGVGTTKAPINPPFAQDLPDLTLSGNVDLPAGAALKSYSGVTTRAGLAPVVRIVNGPLPFTSAELDALTDTLSLAQQLDLAGALNVRVRQLGSDNLIEVLPGAQVGLTGSLLDVQNAAVVTGGRILDVAGVLASSTSQALLRLDPSLLVAVGDFVRVGPGGFLVLDGSLIDALDSDVRATNGGHLVQVLGADGGGSGASSLVALRGLLKFVNSDVFADGSLVSVVGAPGASAAVVLGGPLAVFTNSSVTTGLDILTVFNGGVLSSATTDALIQFVNSTMNAGSRALVNRIVGLIGVGGPTGADFATVVLNGPVLLAVNSSLNNPDGVIGVFPGAQLIVNGSGAPVATIVGGTHALGSSSTGTLLSALGRTTAVAFEVVDGVGLTLGTDQSIVTARTLLESVGASITTTRLAFFDHTLFQATAPIFSGKAGSSLTATVGLELAAQAKVTSLGPVFVLDASLLDVVAGAAILVNGGSLLSVAGDLLALSNGSALRVRNGPLIRVQGNSVLNVTGAMVRFGGTGGNSVNATNLFCVAVCPSVGGIPVALINGASLSNVTITNPIKNGALGTVVAAPPPGVVTVNSPAVIVLDGPNSKVTISGR